MYSLPKRSRFYSIFCVLLPVVISCSPPSCAAGPLCDEEQTPDVPPGSFVLSVTGGGAGTGTVTSSPQGISCTVDNGSITGSCAQPFPEGTVVALNHAAAPGSDFSTFGGACSGASCSVTMSQSQTVSASFDPEPVESPVVDGILSPGEWDAAETFGPVTSNGLTATIYVINDDTDIFVAFQYDRDLSDQNIFNPIVEFDSDGSDDFSAGDDRLLLEGHRVVDLLRDQVYLNASQVTNDGSAGGTVDGEGLSMHVASGTFAELSHSLNSGDSNDMALAQGQIVGINVITNLRNAAGVTSSHRFVAAFTNYLVR